MKSIRKVMAVLYDLKDGKPYYLILHRVLRWNGWELLKGTVNVGESLEQAIKREIHEETGLGEFSVKFKLGKKIEWIWGDYRVIVDEIFVVRADMTKAITLKQRIVEHDAYLWADKNTVLARLTHDNAREILEIVDRKLH